MSTEPTENPLATAEETGTDRLDPWLEDGNIVIAVGKKYFRVHRSVLSSYSGVFKDMFDCTKPSESEGEASSEEFIDQCPVVRLHDAVTDVQIVLKAMYNRSYPLPYYEKVPLSFISAFLRLGEKYNMEEIMDEAKARLSCAHKTKLSIAATMSSSNTLSLFPGITGGDPHNFEMMNLLHEMDLRDALPLAMYQCVVSCPLSNVVDGYKFNDTLYTLSPANLRSWILMKNTLENFRTQLAQNLRVSNNCVVQSSCVLNVRRLWSDEVTIEQPFCPWRDEWDQLFCAACRKDLNMWRHAIIQKTWNQITTGRWPSVSLSVSRHRNLDLDLDLDL